MRQLIASTAPTALSVMLAIAALGASDPGEPSQDEKAQSSEPAESNKPTDMPSENTGDKKDKEAAISEPDQEKAPDAKADTLTEQEKAQKEADTKAFLKAAGEGDLKTVQSLIKKVDINATTGEKGFFALYVASVRSDIAMVRVLIENGADVNQTIRHGYTPLFSLAWSKNDNEKDIEMAQLLIGAGAKTDVKDQWGTSLLLSVIEHNPDFALFLLGKVSKMEIEEEDEDGERPLHYIARYGTVAMAELLISRGCEIDVKAKYGWTPLVVAITRDNYMDLVKLLISKGADVNTKGLDGGIPLHLAVRVHQDKDLVKLLLAQGSDVNAKNKTGFTPLYDAVMKGSIDIIQQLLEAGADINAKDTIGRTPLHFAINRGDKAVKDFLIRHGAKTDIAPLQPGTKPEFDGTVDIAALGLKQKDTSGDIGQSAVQTTELTFSINDNDVTLYSAPEEQEYLHISNLVPFVRVGEPQLPMKTFMVKLPHDSEVLGVEVIQGQVSTIKGKHHIIPTQQAIGQNGRIYYPNEGISARNTFFPGEWVKYETGKDNTNNHVFIRFYPVQYLPTEGQLVVVTEAKLKVYYRDTQRVVTVAHYSDIKDPGEQKKAEEALSPAAAQAVIIFPERLRPAAKKLKAFHVEREGISTALVATESIDAGYQPAEEPPFEGYANSNLEDWDTIVNYDYPLARKIIAYLRNTAVHPQLEYVTILGDGGLVPASYMHHQTLHDFHNLHAWGPTDFLYTSPDYDFVPNYKVGRLPVNDNKEALAMVEKMERWYEQVDQEWFRKIYIHGGHPGEHREMVHKISTVTLDSELIRPLFDGMQVTRSLYNEGLFKHERLQAALRDGQFGFIALYGHGGVDGVRSGGNHRLVAPEVMTYQQVDKLPIVIALACTAGEWALDNNKWYVEDKENHLPTFGEALLKSQAGGVALFGAAGVPVSSLRMPLYYDNGKVILSRYTVFAELSYYNTLKSYHEGADTLGEIARSGAFNFVADNEMDYWLNKYTLFQFVLLGDPALKIPVRVKTVPKAGTRPEPSQESYEPREAKAEIEEGKQPGSESRPSAQPRAPQVDTTKGQKTEAEGRKLEDDKPETPANPQASIGGAALRAEQPAHITKPKYRGQGQLLTLDTSLARAFRRRDRARSLFAFSSRRLMTRSAPLPSR